MRRGLTVFHMLSLNTRFVGGRNHGRVSRSDTLRFAGNFCGRRTNREPNSLWLRSSAKARNALAQASLRIIVHADSNAEARYNESQMGSITRAPFRAFSAHTDISWADCSGFYTSRLWRLEPSLGKPWPYPPWAALAAFYPFFISSGVHLQHACYMPHVPKGSLAAERSP